MRYIVILTGILTFWFFLFIGLYSLVDDPAFSNIANIDGNTSTFTDAISQYSGFNDTSAYSDYVKSTDKIGNIADILGFMFGFSIPFTGFPVIFALIIKFLNYILIVLAIISVYKIINPLSSA